MTTLEKRDDGGRLRSGLLAVGLAALLLTAGCSSVPGIGGGDSASGPALDTVPAGSTTVVYADVRGALRDDAVRTVLNGTVRATAGPGPSPDSLEEVIARAERNSSLDLEGVRSVTVFSKSASAVGDSAGYAAAVVSADWSREAVVSSVRNSSDAEVTESTYAGNPVYHGAASDSWLGFLGDGRFVAGTESAVKDAMDVSAGNANAFDNDVRTAFESTAAGHLRYAASVPQEEFDASEVGSGRYSTAAFNEVTTVSGSLATVEGGNLSLSTRMNFTSESAATDARDVIDGAVTTYRGLTEDNTTERLLSEEHLSVEAEGSTVVVTATNEPDAYVTLFRTYLLLLGGVDTGPIDGGTVDGDTSNVTAPA